MRRTALWVFAGDTNVCAPVQGWGEVMIRCIMCCYNVQLDDIVVRGRSGRGVCLSCYTRETRTVRRPSRALWRQVTAIAAEADRAYDLSVRGTGLDGLF
jgi:hypothetical protein